jgi:hypothetical protein
MGVGVPESVVKLVAAQRLGEIWRVYHPRTASRVLTSFLLLALASGWLVAASLQAFSPPVPPVAVRIGYPLAGLVLAAWAVSLFARALRRKDVRAVLCEYGVVQVGLEGAHAFRFDQVATVLPAGHVYTVVCRDGRQFVFDRLLAEVEDLGRRIGVSVAGVRQAHAAA